MDMTNTEMQTMNDAAVERRIKDMHLTVAQQVAAGELTELQANEWMVAFQDRMMRDGAWS